MSSDSAIQDTPGNQCERSRGSRQALMILIVCLLTVTACNTKPQRSAPTTYPVSGKVTAPNGRSMAGGCIEFKPKENEWELTSTGVINPDGTFSLHVPFVDRVIPGATQGPHRAYVILPLGSQREGGGHVPIPGEFVVKPGENHFTITLPSSP